MKTIGLIGGMSWESTVEYYRVINEAVKARLGGLHSAKCVPYSVDFAEVEEQQRRGQWADAAHLLVHAAQGVERAGAAGIILGCTELDLLVKSEDCRVPLFDTTPEHALAAVERALQP